MINVGIIGASGYTGLELIKMLKSHPHFKLSFIATSKGDTTIDKLHPALKDVFNMDVKEANSEEIAKNCSLVFLALPHKTAMVFAKELLKNGVKVVDLSADYRLEEETYEEYYTKHIDKENLKNSVYGLIEYYRDSLKNTNLVASAGCYPTATLLGILPFIDYLDNSIPLFIDAKSGVSGAGKKLSEVTSFVNINENIFAYNPLKHRHSPEIKEKIKKIKNVEFDINFVPHLIPITRGELVSVYGVLKEDIEPLEILKEAYKNEPFIRVREEPVNVKNTAGTHFCDIFASKKGKSLFVSSSIDNLLRGASSQALVSANLMYGFNETDGILNTPYVP